MYDCVVYIRPCRCSVGQLTWAVSAQRGACVCQCEAMCAAVCGGVRQYAMVRGGAQWCVAVWWCAAV